MALICYSVLCYSKKAWYVTEEASKLLASSQPWWQATILQYPKLSLQLQSLLGLDAFHRSAMFIQSFLLHVTLILRTLPFYLVCWNFSGTEIGMLNVSMGNWNTNLLFGPVVFILTCSMDGGSLLLHSSEVSTSFYICLKLTSVVSMYVSK